MSIDTLTELLAAAALGIALATALLALVYFAVRNSVGTVALLVVMWITTAAFRDSIDLSVTVSSIRVSALDVLSVVLLAIGVIRAISHRVRGVVLGATLGMVVLLTFHIARGLAQFDLQTSLSDAREWLYFVAALVYAATVPGGWDRRVWRLLAVTGVLVAVIAVSFFITEGIGTATELIYREGESVASRPITAAGTLLILQAVILSLTLQWPSRRTAVYLAVGAGAVLLLSQHRTLWVASLLVGVVGFVWWSPRQNRDRVAAATAVILLLLPIAVWGFSQTGPLVESASEVTSSSSTTVWRTTSWEQLTSSHDSASQLAAGNPSGNDLGRLINGNIVYESPHNGFVDAYLRFGLPGVFILSWLGLLLWFRRSSVSDGTGLTAQGVGLLLLTQLVFSIAYSLDLVQGLIAGALVSGLVATSPVRAPTARRFASPARGREYAVR